MDEEIIITKAPGGCEMVDNGRQAKVRQQSKSQTYQSARIATYEISGEGQYMDEEIFITKAPGGCEMVDNGRQAKVRQQSKSQTYGQIESIQSAKQEPDLSVCEDCYL